MKKNITKEEEKALLEIAKRLMAAVDSRGDLEARDNDSEDFIEVPVWGIQKAMEEAYLLGRMNRSTGSPRHSPTQGLVPRVAKRSECPRQGQMWRRGCARRLKHMEERMMDTIVEIYNHMDDSDKDAFTLEDAEDMVEDQIRMDKEAGREPLAYDPQFFYDTIVELMEQDAE